VKLLLDQNLSRRLVPVLDRYFSGTSQVVLIELDKSSDFYGVFDSISDRFRCPRTRFFENIKF